MIGFHTCARSRLSAMNSFCASGTSSSAKIASTGHSGTHSVQSMHSSGSITSMFGPSWKQSTGQTSTQSVYLHLMQLSVTTWVIAQSLVGGCEAAREKQEIIRPSSGALKARIWDAIIPIRNLLITGRRDRLECGPSRQRLGTSRALRRSEECGPTLEIAR